MIPGFFPALHAVSEWVQTACFCPGSQAGLQQTPADLETVCINLGMTPGSARGLLPEEGLSSLHAGKPVSDEFPLELFVEKENGASCFRFSQLTLELSVHFLIEGNVSNGGTSLHGAWGVTEDGGRRAEGS